MDCRNSINDIIDIFNHPIATAPLPLKGNRKGTLPIRYERKGSPYDWRQFTQNPSFFSGA